MISCNHEPADLKLFFNKCINLLQVLVRRKKISDVMTGDENRMGRCKGNPCGCPDNGGHPYGWLGRCRGVLQPYMGEHGLLHMFGLVGALLGEREPL